MRKALCLYYFSKVLVHSHYQLFVKQPVLKNMLDMVLKILAELPLLVRKIRYRSD